MMGDGVGGVQLLSGRQAAGGLGPLRSWGAFVPSCRAVFKAGAPKLLRAPRTMRQLQPTPRALWHLVFLRGLRLLGVFYDTSGGSARLLGALSLEPMAHPGETGTDHGLCVRHGQPLLPRFPSTDAST